MECVQRHLRRRFSHTLGSNTTDHFTRMDHRSLKSALNFSNEPVKGFSGEVFSLDYMLCCQKMSQIDFAVTSGIIICSFKEFTCIQARLLVDFNSVLNKISRSLDYVVRAQITPGSRFNPKLLLRIPNQSWNVDGKMGFVIATRSVFSKLISINFDLLKFFL